jgi:hypothetical protein
VCIKEMPNGFSASTGQGPWSDEHEGQSWCICIWAFSHWVSGGGNGRNLLLQCDAISAKVVDSAFARSHLQGARGGGDYDTAVATLCNTCSGQASNDSQRQHLSEQCRSLGYDPDKEL